jgi:hypothetical protein
MKSKVMRSLGIAAALLMPVTGITMAAAGTAGASLPTSLTFASGSSLKITIGIIGLTLNLSQGTDGVDPTGSVAVSTSGDQFASTQTYTVPGNATHTTMVFPAGTLKGIFTGSSITEIKIVTSSGSSPSLSFHTYTTGIQDCVISSMYNIFYGGTSGTLSATRGSFRTHARAGSATGGTCRSTLKSYLNMHIGTASVSGRAHVS